MLTRRKVTALLPSRQKGLCAPFWPQGGLVAISSHGEVRFGRDGGADCVPLPAPPTTTNDKRRPPTTTGNLAFGLRFAEMSVLLSGGLRWEENCSLGIHSGLGRTS